MSRIIYNGVELGYIRTKSISHEPEYDDTGVDYLYTKVTFEVEAVMNALVTPSQGVNNTPAQQIAGIRSLLETPRKRLQFIVGADTIIDVGANGRDAKNGPLPEPCTINQIGGEATFLISYRVSAWIVECASQGQVPQYQSHRWKETARIDGKTFLTTKTRTGKIYTRSDINSNADALRGAVIPKIDNGFVVKDIECTLQEDGLAMMYSFVEQERYLMVPSPATDAEGEYIESTTTPGGAVRFGECRTRLWGAKTSDRGALLQQAIIICLNQVSPTGQIASISNPGAGPLLVSAAVRQNLYENQIEITMKVRLASTKGRTKQLGMDLGNFSAIAKGSEPGTQPPDPGTRGTAAVKLLVNFLQDPCSPAQTADLGSQAGDVRALSTSALPEVQIRMMKVLPDDTNALYTTSLDSLPGFYTHAQMHTDYKIKTWNAQLPVASPGSVCAIVTLASPTATKTIEGSVEKVGSSPKIPDPSVNDSNLVPLEIWLSPDPAELGEGAGDGTMMTFRRQFRYVYAIIDLTQMVLDGGIPPFIDPQVRGLATIKPEDFIHGLIDGAVSGVLGTVPGQTFPGGGQTK